MADILLPVMGGQQGGALEMTGGLPGGVVGYSIVVRCGEQGGCGEGSGGGGGGKEEAVWQRLHAVSAFGQGQPMGGIC